MYKSFHNFFLISKQTKLDSLKINNLFGEIIFFSFFSVVNLFLAYKDEGLSFDFSDIFFFASFIDFACA